MKKPILILFVIALQFSFLPLQSFGQNHRDSRYYNPRTGQMDYSQSPERHRPQVNTYLRDQYFGFRVGPSFSFIGSDDPYLKGSTTRTGLNIGVAAGFALSRFSPIYLETGLYYTEKGGKGKNYDFGSYSDSRFTTRLGYLEIPLQVKYIQSIAPALTIQPFVGGYFDVGICGKIKDFGQREAYDSFSDNRAAFKRCDAGLRFGCGVGYEMLYAEVAYDLGLANIGHNDFDTAANRAFLLTFGVNF